MKGQELVLSEITKNYGETRAVDGVNLKVAPGSLTTLLGPSGCGKTSLLRIIAGLTPSTSGQVFLGSRDLTQVPASHRNIGVVFQSYALFPHMSVADNVAFGLRARRVSRQDMAVRVKAALERVKLEKLGDRYPGQLSGGQQQRTALARALVIEPDLLLLDEPLSALDKNLRSSVQQELRRLQKDIGITTVVVTHDQDEAFVLSDEIVVMGHGKVLQEGKPDQIYDHPRTRFVAEFLGDGNFIDPRVEEIDLSTIGARTVRGERDSGVAGASLFFRPEHVELRSDDDGASGFAGVRVRARVVDVINLGGSYHVALETGKGSRLTAYVARRDGGSIGLGQDMTVVVRADDLTWLAT